MNPCELTASITALANAIACQLDDETLAVTAASFAQLGDTLATIAVQRDMCARRREACRAACEAWNAAKTTGESTAVP